VAPETRIAECRIYVLRCADNVYRTGVPDDDYLPRFADRLLTGLLAELPAVLVTGPRAAGKTTSVKRLAAEVFRLDDPAVADR